MDNMKCVLASAAVLCLVLPVWGDTYLVLPFFNASRAANLDWIGESVSESIREALTNGGLVTLARDDRREGYRRLGLRANARLTRATVIKIGQALDAEQVVYGEYDLQPPPPGSNSRGSLKITAHVLNLKALKQGPEFSEIDALENLAGEQARVAWQTLEHLMPEHGLSEEEFRHQRPPVRIDAMENYIRGLLAPSPEQKQKLFTEAVRLQPGYSQASYQLGLLAYSHLEYRTAADWLQKVSPTDLQYRQAMFYLGICRYETGDFAAAERAFALVAKTVPLNEVLNNLGAAQSRENRPEAVDNLVKALEGDPSDPVYQFNVGYALWRQQKFEAAAERFRAVLDRDPQDSEATTMLGRCLKHSPPSQVSSERLERIKTTYEESAYWQLKAVLQPQKR
jgi:tetratricopeptide (TPR) repeat protein